MRLSTTLTTKSIASSSDQYTMAARTSRAPYVRNPDRTTGINRPLRSSVSVAHGLRLLISTPPEEPSTARPAPSPVASGWTSPVRSDTTQPMSSRDLISPARQSQNSNTLRKATGVEKQELSKGPTVRTSRKIVKLRILREKSIQKRTESPAYAENWAKNRRPTLAFIRFFLHPYVRTNYMIVVQHVRNIPNYLIQESPHVGPTHAGQPQLT